MKKTAFSLVEMLVVLIVMSIVIAALTPVITKRLKNNSVNVSAGSDAFLVDCPEWEDCVFCTRTQCSLCQKNCGVDEYANTPDCSCKKCSELVSNCYSCSQKKCTKCYGGYGISSDKMVCTKCVTGTYSTGSTGCIEADKGHYVASDGASSQTPCEIGKYQPNKKQTSCTTCDEGKYTANTGNSSCSTCEEDHKCTGGIRTQCARNQGAVAGSNSCSACPINCIDCKVPSTCIECSSTYYISGGQCVQCSAGYSCNGKTRSQCSAETAAALGAGVCSACGSGKYSAAGASSCTNCSATWSNCTGCNVSGCTSCATNFIVKDGKCVSAGIKYTCSPSTICSESALPNGKKLIKITANGTFTVDSAPSEDAIIFAVGGGGAGGHWDDDGGVAGKGGGINKTTFTLSLNTYAVTIGTGGKRNCGSGGESIFALNDSTKISASGGSGCSTSTVIPGTLFNGTYYAGSGSHGVMWGQSSDATSGGGGSGGGYNSSGNAGTANTGGGGGGGGTGCSTWYADDPGCKGGNGGSGIILIETP